MSCVLCMSLLYSHSDHYANPLCPCRNGRDIHRELCGFFFLVDGSITIYEYRQFGQRWVLTCSLCHLNFISCFTTVSNIIHRSSALPMIQRKTYKHMFGPLKGNPYEINVIKKGFNLHFRTCDHPGLPDTLSRRPVLALRITYVDENVKKHLL